tara:strand:+ start:12031 stop:14148 length:2118 start_codon:yes stop_codon:yes gene_type:complete
MADGEELKNNLSDSSEILDNIRDIAVQLESVLGSMAGEFKEQLKGGSVEVKAIEEFTKRSVKNLTSSAGQLAKLSKESLKGDKSSVNISKELAKAKANQLIIQSKIKLLADQLLVAEGDEADALQRSLETLVESADTAGILVNKFQEVNDAASEIDSKGSYFDKAKKFVEGIPVLSGLLGPGFEAASKGLKNASLEENKLKKGLMQTSAVAGGIGKIVDIGFVAMLTKADSSTTNLAKQLAVSKETARGLRASFNSIAIDSGTSALNAQNLTESFIELGSSVGAVSGFNNEQIEQQGKLTKLVGLQGGEAAKLAEFGMIQGTSTREATTDILQQVKLLEQETGIRLEGRKILAEVANVSGRLGAQYGFNTQQIAKAVVQSQRLGLSLEDTAGIAGNLLDFESSITKELQAELLIGKDLNLEQARLLALQGDSAGAAAELAKQFGTAEEFSSLNVIQQQSLADAMGMSVDQLSDSIRKQQVLSSLGAESVKQLEKQGRLDELRGDANGELILQQYEQQSAADAFANSVMKIQAAFGSLMEGPLGSVVDMMVGLADSSFAVYTAIGLMAGVSLIRVIGSIAGMAASLVTAGVASAATASALTLGIGAIAIIAGTAAITAGIMSAQKKAKTMTAVDDAIIPSGYGDRVISSPKGSIALNNQDTLVAGTNLGQNGGNQETKRTNALLEALVMQNKTKQKISPIGLYEVQ